MSELRKDASGGLIAQQDDMDAWQAALSAEDVEAYIAAEASDIDAYVASGDINVTAGSGTVVNVVFNEDATGDKANALKALASNLQRGGTRAAAPVPEDPEDSPLPQPASWAIEAGAAKSWASRCQNALDLW